eukprot:725491-Amphidinium_carterae.1
MFEKCICSVLFLVARDQVDVVSRWSTDIFVRERDALTQLMLGYDARVLDFMKLATEWIRLNQEQESAARRGDTLITH